MAEGLQRPLCTSVDTGFFIEEIILISNKQSINTAKEK
jgi:hypothetical protein